MILSAALLLAKISHGAMNIAMQEGILVTQKSIISKLCGVKKNDTFQHGEHALAKVNFSKNRVELAVR